VTFFTMGQVSTAVCPLSLPYRIMAKTPHPLLHRAGGGPESQDFLGRTQMLSVG
jgi:hypothetical protein